MTTVMYRALPTVGRPDLDGEYLSTRDEARGRRVFRRWVPRQLSALPKSHPARVVFLDPVTGRLRSGLHAGHELSPTKVRARKTAGFAIHEGRANVRNQANRIKVRWVRLAPGVAVPVEARDTLPALERIALRNYKRTTGARRKEWADLLGNLRQAARSHFRPGVRLPVAEGEWFLTASQDGIPLPPPRIVCCTDREVAKAFGIPLNSQRNGLYGFDAAFSTSNGKAFADLVRRVAQQVDLNPGLLAANALAEVQSPAFWLQAGPVRNDEVGVDYWDEERSKIRAAVPAALLIRDRTVRNASGNTIPFRNEQGNNTGPKHEFATGPDGLLALASAIAWRQKRLRASLAPGRFDALSTPVRFTALRIGFNPGMKFGLRFVRNAAAGRRVLVRQGPAGPHHGYRAATIRAGQAIHLSCKVFGLPQSCV